MSDHGRIIPLTSEPYERERHVEVYASNGAELEEPTVAEAVKEHLDWVRKRSTRNRMRVLKRAKTTLDGHAAQRVVVRYYDKKIRGWFVEDFVEALRDTDEFSIYLRTPQSDYARDKPVFEAIVSSFCFQNPQEESSAPGN